MSSTLIYPENFIVDEPSSNLRGVAVKIFVTFLWKFQNYLIQCRPCFNITFYSVWPGSSLFLRLCVMPILDKTWVGIIICCRKTDWITDRHRREGKEDKEIWCLISSLQHWFYKTSVSGLSMLTLLSLIPITGHKHGLTLLLLSWIKSLIIFIWLQDNNFQ